VLLPFTKYQYLIAYWNSAIKAFIAEFQ